MYAIICPLKSELSVVRQTLDQNRYPMVLGGHGKVNFAIQATQLLLKNPEVETLICVGGGGALSPEVSPFDVVVGSHIIEHDYYEKFDPTETLPQVKTKPEFLSSLKDFENIHFQLHIGAIASGDEDIVSKERAEQLSAETGALAVAWEGIGGAKACRQFKKNYIEVRGVTDSCGASASQDFAKNLQQAMFNSTEVVRQIIQDHHS